MVTIIKSYGPEDTQVTMVSSEHELFFLYFMNVVSGDHNKLYRPPDAKVHIHSNRCSADATESGHIATKWMINRLEIEYFCAYICATFRPYICY